MELIERWPIRGDEIQVWSLTPREASYFNDRDNERRTMAIFRYWVKRIFKLGFNDPAGRIANGSQCDRNSQGK